ncbi:MAG: hypothetical protein K2Z81_04005, partial [Cyanobacteria bacterium]|nr:hypothetical protein [Cyanobacteriota bacterium]
MSDHLQVLEPQSHATDPSGEVSVGTENGADALRNEFIATLDAKNSNDGSTSERDEQSGSATPNEQSVAAAETDETDQSSNLTELSVPDAWAGLNGRGASEPHNQSGRFLDFAAAPSPFESGAADLVALIGQNADRQSTNGAALEDFAPEDRDLNETPAKTEADDLEADSSEEDDNEQFSDEDGEDDRDQDSDGSDSEEGHPEHDEPRDDWKEVDETDDNDDEPNPDEDGDEDPDQDSEGSHREEGHAEHDEPLDDSEEFDATDDSDEEPSSEEQLKELKEGLLKYSDNLGDHSKNFKKDLDTFLSRDDISDQQKIDSLANVERLLA